MPDYTIVSKRAEFLNNLGFATDVVPVPELGEKMAVRVRAMSAYEVEEIGLGSVDKQGNLNVQLTRSMRAKIVAWAVIDENDDSLFTDKDVRALNKKSYAVILRISTRVMELSGMEDEEKRLMIECPECGCEHEVDLVALGERYDNEQAATEKSPKD